MIVLLRSEYRACKISQIPLTAFAYAPYIAEDKQALAPKVLHLPPVGGRSYVACIV